MKATLATIIIIIGLAVAGYILMQPKDEFTLDATPMATQITPTPLPSSITELKMETLVEGSGPQAKAGDTISVLYVGTRLDGSILDASGLHNNEPFSFTLGSGQVIKGFDQGLMGVRKGEKRKIFIPMELAYGNESLIFEVDVLTVTSAK
ncbi:MAG: FKBP-type peptidyl-prolyl cis-trans isomerase [Patescibacteria group bacterium]